MGGDASSEAAPERKKTFRGHSGQASRLPRSSIRKMIGLTTRPGGGERFDPESRRLNESVTRWEPPLGNPPVSPTQQPAVTPKLIALLTCFLSANESESLSCASCSPVWSKVGMIQRLDGPPNLTACHPMMPPVGLGILLESQSILALPLASAMQVQYEPLGSSQG